MAMTDTRPDDVAHDHHESRPSLASFDAALGSGDHKTTGRLWIGAGALMLAAALVVSLVAAIEHVDLGSLSMFDQEGQFVQIWSMGRILLLLGGLVPILIGIATFVVPLQVGASSLAFPRGAATAFWCWLVSTSLLIISYILNGGPAGGRTDYVVLWTLALGAMVLSVLWAMVCIATTIVGARAPGMDLDQVPVSAWSFFVFSLLGLFILPVVLGQLVLVYLDVKYGFLFDRSSRLSLLGIGDSLTLAPTLYWVGIPTLGIAIEAIAVHTGRPVCFHRSVMVALGGLGILSFGVDLLSYSSRGVAPVFDNGVLVVGLIVAALPVLAALALAGESLKTGSFRVRTPLVAGLLGGLVLLLAVVASILGTVWPIVTFIEDVFDTNVTLDSSFDLTATAFHEGIRALVMGAGVLGVIAGVHHWGHKIWGRSLDDRLGLLTTLTAAGGAIVWGIGGVVNGFLGEPALPIISNDVQDGVEALNGVMAAGAGLLAAAAVLLLLNIARTAFGGGSSNEPWQGVTLEWATASPPIAGNFATAPRVTSATPILDMVSNEVATTVSVDEEASEGVSA
jgi:heme/copper-type cytochrome/quinol oxidase subunit 1